MPQITIKNIETPALVMDEDGEFVCPHDNYTWETTEVDTMRNGEHDTYEVPVAVCDNCNETLDIEPEEPDYE